MFFNAPTSDSLPVAVREAAVVSFLPDALCVALSPLAPRGMRCTTTEAHAPLVRLPNEWTIHQATRIGRRAASGRILAVNVEQLVLRSDNDDPTEVATSVANPERSAVCLWNTGVTRVG